MALTAVAVAARPLTPARQQLAEAICWLRAAQAALERATGPAERLQRLVADAAEADRRLAEARAADEAALGEWLANPTGDRPQPPPEIGELAARAATLAVEAKAAEKALPPLLERRGQAAAAVAEAAGRRDDALPLAAVEAAEALLSELRARVAAALEIEACVRGLAAELQGRSIRGESRTGADAAGRIVERIVATKHEPAIALDLAGARAFLDRLASDAGARL